MAARKRCPSKRLIGLSHNVLDDLFYRLEFTDHSDRLAVIDDGLAHAAEPCVRFECSQFHSTLSRLSLQLASIRTERVRKLPHDQHAKLSRFLSDNAHIDIRIPIEVPVNFM